MKEKAPHRSSVNVKLLTIVFAGIVTLAVLLTVISSYFIYSSFSALYRERLSSPSRTLLSQYSHLDIAKYVDALKSISSIVEDSERYLADRQYVIAMQNEHSAPFPQAYQDAKQRMIAYANHFSSLKDEKYIAFNRSLLATLTATGVSNVYVIADLGLDEGFVFIFNTFFQADSGILFHDDLGTVDSKANYPGVAQAYKTGEPVYVIGKASNSAEGVSHSYTPVKNSFGHTVAIICVDADLQSISEQLDDFMFFSVALTLLILIVVLLVMLFILQKTIIRPVKTLTNISTEIANGNVYVEIPKETLGREDEMGVLGRSYETMRATLGKLIAINKALFQDIIIGKLDTRGDSTQFSGLFAQLIDNTNDTLDVIGLYFDSIPASFVILDPMYDIAFSNKNFRETFSAFSAKQLLQKLLEDDDDEYSSLKVKLSAAIRREELHFLRWFSIGDEHRCFSFICSSVAHAENESGAIIVILDNTELVLAKDNALSASRAKSEFLSRISHELRTPLNAILSMARLGLNDNDPGKSTNRFEQIVTSSAHLSNIINDVLEMSRMESGKTEIRNSLLSVSALVDECVAMLALRAQENENTLTSRVDPAIPARLIGDAFRIKQVMINLLSNAAKFTEAGTISIDVTCVEKSERSCTLQFAVSDTGIGISEAFLTKLFAPFEQEDSFLSRRFEGSGLGLPISHHLIALMGGTMDVSSELGKGSRFAFTLPLQIAPSEQPQPEKPDAPADEGLSIAGKRVLLVDDIEINRMIVVEILGDTGVLIEEAADGEEALEKFLQSPPHHFDCILMDIQMPKLDGYKAATAIRQSARKDSDTPIIAMTANALKEDIDQAMECGMNDHLAKPIDFGLCLQTIRRFCNTQPAQRELSLKMLST